MNKRLKNILTIVKDGDIILIQNLEFNIVSNRIQWFTNSRWNHTVWFHGPKHIYHWTTWRARKDKLKKYIIPQYRICIRRSDPLSKKQVEKIYELAKKDVKKKRKYAKKAYLGYAIFNLLAKIPFLRSIRRYDNPWKQYNQKVCSSGIIERWFQKAAGIILCPDTGEEQTTPEDIYQAKVIRTIYEEAESWDCG